MAYKNILLSLLSLVLILILIFIIYQFMPKVSNFNTLAINAPKQFQTNTEAKSFQSTSSEKKVLIESKVETLKEDYDYDDLLLLQNRQKEVQAKMKLLTINTNFKSTIEETCYFENTSEIESCKKDLFVGCGDSLYLGLEMAPECEQFSSKDYLKFIDIKKKQEDEKIKSSEILQTEFGEVNVIESEYTSKNDPDLKNSINSSSINTDKIVKNTKEIIEERKIIEPEKAVISQSLIKWNTFATSNFYGWVTGWGTLFAINGGKKEAGQVMNKYTAFGYNPYLASTCIVSLPYKTVDRFFGTSLDYCVKTKNTACILKIKNSIKNRAIEVVMLKNGKRAVFPLGDFGPAEWTGNAIDFTSCARSKLGATGKDLIKFRPLPY